ncbi:ionotropic receptor 75a-like [Euwallacea similis]|uniref:ionotropic receptor 75a-like n=1 Tax=Euwallacea similis TaxID=1736056 RepID=UPI0034502C4F
MSSQSQIKLICDLINLHRLLVNLEISHSQLYGHLFTVTNFSRIFITDMLCKFFNQLLQEAISDKKLLTHPNKWIIFGNIANLKSYSFYLPINSNIVIIDTETTTQNNTVSIRAVYQMKNSYGYFEDIIAEWSPVEKFNFFNQLTPIKNRTNFFGMPLRVSYVITDNRSLQHDTLINNRHKHIDKPSKINYHMYDHLVDIWNMTHQIVIRKEWGMEFDPTKLYYKGMLGDLCHDRADAAGTIQFTPKERFKYFKFLVSTAWQMAVFFMFKAPPLPYSSNLFAMPFDIKAWIGCGVVLFSCCFVIWVIIKWENGNPDFIRDREENEENSTSFLDVLIGHIAAVAQMSCSFQIRSSSAKIATFSLLLGFCYIYNAFCARIVLLLQSTATNLQNYKALYEAKMDMGVERTPYNIYYFSNPNSRTNEKWRKLIYDHKIAPNGRQEKFYAASEGVKLIQHSFFAFHVEYTTASDLILSSFTSEEVCSIRQVESIYKGDIPYLSCPVNSTFAEYLLIGLERILETGLHSRQARRTFSKLPKCTGKSKIFVSVGLVECYFAFEVFLIGVLLSLIIISFELMINFYLKRQKRNDILIISHN